MYVLPVTRSDRMTHMDAYEREQPVTDGYGRWRIRCITGTWKGESIADDTATGKRDTTYHPTGGDSADSITRGDIRCAAPEHAERRADAPERH